MRGTYKDEVYFSEKLKQSDADAEHFETLVAKTVSEKGESDRGVQAGFSILCSTYQKRINLLYTAGSRDNEIEPCFEHLLKYYAKTWEPRCSYFDLVKVLSLAVLLDVKADNELLSELIEKIRKAEYRDYLSDMFLRYLVPSYDLQSPDFRWKNTYQPLKEVVENAASDAVNLLKLYLEEQWYGIHKECAWYGSHKTDFYYGYWSFEAGAAAKVLGLEDGTLKDQKYYPYDLVHR